MIDWVVRALAGWKRLLDAIEDVLVDAVAATVPWLAPAIPAYMTYWHVVWLFEWPEGMALVAAAVVEGIGLSAVSTTYKLWRYNRQYASRSAGPLALAVGVSGYYLLVVLVVNVLLDVTTAEWALVVGKGLLVTLSVVAMVILALRSGYAWRLAEDEALRRRKVARKVGGRMRESRGKVSGENGGKLPEGSVEISEGKGAGFRGGVADVSANRRVRGDWRVLTDGEKAWIAGASRGEVMERYGVTSKTAKAWRERLSRNGGGA